MRELEASLAVEAALVFPFITVILFLLLQCGLVLTERVFCQSLCEQGVMVYAEARRAGYSDKKAKAFTQDLLEKRTALFFPESGTVELSSETAGLGNRVQIYMSAEYGFLFPLEFEVSAVGDYRSPVAVRDSVCLVQEIGAKIPAIQSLKSELKEKLGGWLNR